MRLKFPIILLIFSLCLSFILFNNPATASNIDDEIAEVSRQIEELEKAIAPLKTESSSLKSKIAQAKSQILKTENQIKDIGNRLIDKESDLQVQKTLLSQRVRRYYINSQKFNPLLIFFSTSESSNLVRQYTWFQSIISQDKNTITRYVSDINSLVQNKTTLEGEKGKLANLRKTLEDRFGFLSTEIKKAEDYKAELSKKQQELVAAKTAMFNTSVGDVSSSDDPASRSDFNPGFSPAFAAFSFGAPHRKGMSQYGAYGRAKAGQNYEAILKAYYGDIRLEKIDSPGSISTGIGSLPFEDSYLVGIAEMPSSWGDKGGMEALKAQAVAARTYALASTNWRMSNRNSTGSICVTEACQVYKTSKFQNPGVWKQAVEATRGIIAVSNNTNDVFSTMYASTSGGAIYSYTSLGHSTPQIWDTSCNSQSCWPNDSFERSSGSPWYYKGWYKTRSNQACGRSHPWLTQSEFADIVNAVLYFSKTKDSSHLSQIDSGGCFGGNDPNAWSVDELRRQVSSHGGPVSSVSSANVDYSTGGYTTNISISTDKGQFNFSVDDFQSVFNLRAPGAVVIKSGLFNIEKK